MWRPSNTYPIAILVLVVEFYRRGRDTIVLTAAAAAEADLIVIRFFWNTACDRDVVDYVPSPT